MVDLIITLSIGIIGCVLAKKFELPSYAFVGPVIAVGAYNIIFGGAYIPTEIRPAIQIIAGIFIGSRMRKEDVAQLKKSFKPIIISVGSILIYSIIMGFGILKITDTSYVTSALATAPGGIIDMTLIGMELGADMAFVSTMQLVRILSIITVLPFVINKMLSCYKDNNEKLEHSNKNRNRKSNASIKNFTITLLVGIIAGTLGYLSRIPAMTLIATMTCVAVQSIFFDNAYLPKVFRIIVRIVAGILIGQTLTIDAVLSLKALVIPVLVMTVVYILMTVIIGTILYKTTNLDYPTALFACCPGGATNVALICEDFGADSVMVSVIQYPRLFAVIVLYPIIIQSFG